MILVIFSSYPSHLILNPYPLPFPLLLAWPDSNMTSAVGGCHSVRGTCFMGLFASRPSNAPVLWDFLHLGSKSVVKYVGPYRQHAKSVLKYDAKALFCFFFHVFGTTSDCVRLFGTN